MSKKRIAVIAGDGIGKEVMPEGVRVMEAAATRFNIDLQFDHFDFGSWDYCEKHGKYLPDDWKDQIGGHDAIFFGAVGWPDKIPDHVSLWQSLLLFRREFDQYVNLRPARLMPGIIAALTESGTPLSILTKGTLLRRDLPLCSVIRPSSPALAGARAAAAALTRIAVEYEVLPAAIGMAAARAPGASGDCRRVVWSASASARRNTSVAPTCTTRPNGSSSVSAGATDALAVAGVALHQLGLPRHRPAEAGRQCVAADDQCRLPRRFDKRPGLRQCIQKTRTSCLKIIRRHKT